MPDEHERRTKECPPLNAAVFAGSGLVGIVRLGTPASEKAVAEAVASGFTFAGSIGVNEGAAVVSCEPGFAAEMALGVYQFAGLLGDHLKAHQTRPPEHQMDSGPESR